MSCSDHPEDPSPATLTLAELERVYREAVAHGADLIGLDVADERTAGTLELLAAITVRVPHLTLLLASPAEASRPLSPGAACVAREARRQSAAIVRLAHRALEVHARDVGYDPEAWRERALLGPSAAAATGGGDVADELGAAGFELGRASVALAVAITAVPTDRIAVPTHLADALGGWLFCYAHARHRAHP
jgi:hypothetical protein